MALNFSPEEIQEIRKLPRIKVKKGGSLIDGHVDVDNKTLYLCDSDGVPVNRIQATETFLKAWEERNTAKKSEEDELEAPPSKHSKRHKKDKDESGADDDAPVESEPASTDTDEDDESHKKPAAKRIALAVVLIVIAVALVIVSFSSMSGSVTGLVNNGNDSQTVEVTATPGADIIDDVHLTADAESDEEDGFVYLIQATTDILKGDILEERMFSRVELSTYEYNQLIAVGTSPLKWAELSSILGMYASNTITTGQYIGTDDIAVDNPVVNNPWASYDSSQHAIITLSVDSLADDSTPYLGAICKLEFSRAVEGVVAESDESEEYNDNAEDGGESSDNADAVEGLEVTTEQIEGLEVDTGGTYTVNVYRIDNCVITDILNSEGNTVYPYFAQYFDLPAIRQIDLLTALASDETFQANTKPAYIVIRITASQQAAIGDVTNDSITVTLTGDSDTSSDTKASVASSYKTIVNILDAAASSSAVESADAEAADDGGGTTDAYEDDALEAAG